MDKRLLFLKILRRHWLLLVFGYGVVLVDPFGVGSSTSKAISNAFDRLVSPFYSAILATGGPVSADLVDVILIDDSSIRTLSNEENGYLTANDWPLAYSDHGVVIDALRRRGYGTVILDITFYRARSTDDSYASLVTRLTHFRDTLGMDVILSAGAYPTQLEDSIQPLTETATELGLAGWAGHGDLYPLKKAFAGEYCARTSDNCVVPTLALAGYRAYCRRTGWSGCEDLSKAEEALFVPKPAGMHLNWGMPASRMAPSVKCQPPRPDSALRKLANILRRNIFGPETVDNKNLQTCPPLPTATLSDVFCSECDCNSFFEDSEPPGKRIAMVGVSLPSARDLFDPPTPGRLPGVYLHAEALRNLLLYGSDYFKPVGLSLSLGFIGLPGAGWTLPLDLLIAWPVLLVIVVGGARLVLNWRWKRNGPSKLSEWSELAVELAEITIVIFLLGLIYSATLAAHRTPGFLADLISLTPLLLVAIRKERKEMENERSSLPAPVINGTD